MTRNGLLAPLRVPFGKRGLDRAHAPRRARIRWARKAVNLFGKNARNSVCNNVLDCFYI